MEDYEVKDRDFNVLLFEVFFVWVLGEYLFEFFFECVNVMEDEKLTSAKKVLRAREVVDGIVWEYIMVVVVESVRVEVEWWVKLEVGLEM